MMLYASYLPIGYWKDDTFHKIFSLKPITGQVEDDMHNGTVSTAHRVTKLLASCTERIGSVTSVTPEVIRELSVSDRDYLLFKLRELTFGPKIECILTCPNDECGKKMDVDFNIDDVGFENPELDIPYFVYEEDGGIIEFRLPNGGDLERVADYAVGDPALAETIILERCVVSINGKRPSDDGLAGLTKKQKEGIQKRMEEVDQSTNLDMRIECPECGNEFLAPFDIQDFFLSELNPSINSLYREVHHLAFYYHWTEQEILSFPRWKRKKYIELLMNELARRGEEVL